jgi:hypothetical protein
MHPQCDCWEVQRKETVQEMADGMVVVCDKRVGNPDAMVPVLMEI